MHCALYASTQKPAEDNPAAQRQIAVAAYLKSKQLLLFVFALRSVCQYSMAEDDSATQRQTAVTAYFTSKQLLLFVFAWRSVCQFTMAEENPAAQRQTAVTANFPSSSSSSYCCLSLHCALYASTQRPAEDNPAAQRQIAVAAYLKSKQLLLFVFALRSVCQYSMTEENPAAQRQTPVTAHFTSKQLLLLIIAWPRQSSKYEMLPQCWIKVAPASQTVA